MYTGDIDYKPSKIPMMNPRDVERMTDSKIELKNIKIYKY